MFRRLFSIGGAFLLAGAMVVLAAQPVQAQRHGGNRGGGWYGGGWYGGGYYGGYRGGYYGYRPYYGSYYDYPYYGGYGWSSRWGPRYYYTPTYTVPYQDLTPTYSSGYTPAADTTAHVTVRAPANARVWIGGWETPNTGGVREFDSPPLTPGKQYSYEVRAQWEEDGRMVTQTQEVDVSAGARSQAVFPMTR
ncbi:MAG: TIGR03000 domain-containing protein [Planctomycetes bacterium]|nr:TIGR03000 domain-containing protein [Planctomycetota bacterium]